MYPYIQSGPERIGELLSRQRRYRVPQHQRDYSWTEDQVSQFWEDIQTCLSNRDENPDHFFGALVFKQIEEDKVYEIIDGQQRLATTLMLLAAIRDVYTEHGDTMGQQIQSEYFGRLDRRTRQIQQKFIMNTNNNEFYEQFIATATPLQTLLDVKKKQTTKPTNKKMLDAYLYLKGRINETIKSEGKNTKILADLEEFLLTKQSVILITVNDEADAFTLFETLNERGLELSILDLLKNHIFGIAKDKIEIVKQNWLQMTANLDDDVGVRYLRHYWVSKNGRVQSTRLFRKMRDGSKTKPEVIKLSEDLRENSIIYSALSTADHSIWDDLTLKNRERIRSLNALNAVQCYPVLLAAYANFDVKDFERVVHQMLVMAVRYSLICSYRTGALEIKYADTAHQISLKKFRNAASVFRNIMDIYPSDEEFYAAFLNKEIRTAKQARHLLRELEWFKTEGKPSSDPDVLNLEHIMPKQKNQHWKAIGNLKGLEYENWVFKIGNQMLLEKKINKDVTAKGFDEKKIEYVKTGVILSKGIGNKACWTTTEIEMRQTELATLAVKCWKYEL